MRNPTYEKADKPSSALPYTESTWKLDDEGKWDHGPVLSIGIRTMTHGHRGNPVSPIKVVCVELRDGDERVSTWVDAATARLYSKRLLEFADAIESEKAS